MEESISSIISSSALNFEPTMDINRAKVQMVEHGSTEAYIVSNKGKYIGKLNLLSLTLASQQATILGLTDKDALVLKSDASIQQAIEAAANFIGETIPVIDKETDAFIGAINEGDIFKLYLKLQGQTVDLEKS